MSSKTLKGLISESGDEIEDSEESVLGIVWGTSTEPRARRAASLARLSWY